MQCARVLLSPHSNFSRQLSEGRQFQVTCIWRTISVQKRSPRLLFRKDYISENQIVILLVHFIAGFTSPKFLFISCFKGLIHVTVDVAFYVFTVTDSKAVCKRTQHCWPTTPNIIICCMLRPFVHPLACCWMLLRKVWNRSNFSANNSQHFFCSVIAEA